MITLKIANTFKKIKVYKNCYDYKTCWYITKSWTLENLDEKRLEALLIKLRDFNDELNLDSISDLFQDNIKIEI